MDSIEYRDKNIRSLPGRPGLTMVFHGASVKLTSTSYTQGACFTTQFFQNIFSERKLPWT